VREQERDKRESEEEILERETGTGRQEWLMFLYYYIAMKANTQLKVRIERNVLFLYKKAKNNGMLHLLMFRGCNRYW
jgi:hypothetical protein